MICPICNFTADAFLPFGVVPRPNAQCPNCNSMERHRLLWLYLQERTNFFDKTNMVLDIAPSYCIAVRWDELFADKYVSVDLSSPLAKFKMDITDLRFEDNVFDWIICYHVLEHIPDDNQAMKEIHRVLKPGGAAIIQVPIFCGPTYEDLTIIAPEEREKAYGQSDHVRKYGSDYAERLRRAGFNVKVDQYVKELGQEKISIFGLPEYEDIHFCTKQ